MTAAPGSCPRLSSTRSTRRRSMRRPVAWVSSGAATAVAAGAPRTPFATPNARTRPSRSPTRRTANPLRRLRLAWRLQEQRWRRPLARNEHRSQPGDRLLARRRSEHDHRPSTRAADSSASSRAATAGPTGGRSQSESSTRSHSTHATPGSSSPRARYPGSSGAATRAAPGTPPGRATGDAACVGRLLRWPRGPWRSRSAANTPTRQRTRAASTPAATVDAAGASLPPRPGATR